MATEGEVASCPGICVTFYEDDMMPYLLRHFIVFGLQPRGYIRRGLAQHDFYLGWLEQILYFSG
jgi:hypothetical protein